MGMAATLASTRGMPPRAGVGLRLPHLAEVAATRPSIDCLEIHPENFLANPHATELLIDLSRQYPISVHLWGSILVFLLTRGPGPLSLDHLIARFRATQSR